VKLVLVQPTLTPATLEDPMRAIRARLAGIAGLSREDVVLLPEHVHPFGPRSAYLKDVAELAVDLGAHVVGGSFHEDREGGAVNAGVVVSPEGSPVGEYEKLRPYAAERSRVRPGARLGEITIGGRHVLVLICADFWFTDLFFRTANVPDLVLVPAFSVTRKPTPDYSRALWRHLAVARAYELGVYVGVSDWAHAPDAVGWSLLPTSGVGGFADPVTTDPVGFYTPIGDSGLLAVDLDFEALHAFREDRAARGFFWRDLREA
jgi:predicted amidohydrolase